MTDRLPNSPGKYSAVVTGGELQKMQTGKPFAITLQLDDDPVKEGTPYSKAAVLPDELAEKICPGIEDPMPKDAFIGLWEKKVDGIGRKTGAAIALNDSAHTPLKGLKLFGKTTQNGIPTPENPVDLETTGASGNIAVTISGNQENQILTASTPNGLPGIPIPSGGNYTDENGQQWICDEIDFARGVYVKRVYEYTCTGAEAITVSGNTNEKGYCRWNVLLGITDTEVANYVKNGQIVPSLSNKYTAYSADALSVLINNNNEGYGFAFITNARVIFSTDSTVLADFIAEITGTKILYQLTTPVETALSAEELEAYAKLHTNQPYTTAFNDAGADMEIAYYTPTTAVQMVHSPADAGKVLSIDEHGCVALTVQKDRVVEQGVSGIWTYRKWDSGIAECWLKYTATVDTSNAFGGSPVWDKFYRSHTSEIPLPVVFTEVPMFNVSVSGGTVVIFNGTTYVSNSMVNMIQLNSYVRTEDTSKSYSITYCVHAIGRWK